MEFYLGEIKTFAYDKVPKGWLACDGSLLTVRSHQALYSLLGNQFGGEPGKTFVLPDLMGRVMVNQGRNNELSYRVGDAGGLEAVQLKENEMPAHRHQFNMIHTSSTKTANSGLLSLDLRSSKTKQFKKGTYPGIAISRATISATGEGVAHDNRMPYLTLLVCICEQGDYPPFNDF